MLHNISGVIFDLDGTLVDSMWMWRDIDIEYLGSFGIALPEGLQQAIEGMSFTETACYFKATFSLPVTVAEIKATWVAMAHYKYTHEVPLKEGARQFLEYLKENHIPAGVATSNARDLVEDVCRAPDLNQYFQSIRTSCEVSAGKPAPDIYLKVADDIGITPDQCLVFEDIPNGILAGENAGMKVCAVADPFSEDLREEKRELADYYIDSFNHIFTKEYEVLVS